MKKLHNITQIVLFLASSILNLNSNAQEVDTAKFQEALQMPFEDLLNTKIITASKKVKASTSVTQKVDIVSANEIEKMPYAKRNIAELIEHLPGASVKALSRNDANWGAYGGIGPKYNTYMVNGLPIDAFIDPQSLNPVFFQRIEVQRGPASILYPNYLSQDFAGNQCPLAGTVNLILKEGIKKPKTDLSLSYGTYKTISTQAYHENNFGKLEVMGGISFQKSDYTNYGSEGSWLNMLKNPEYEKLKLSLGVNSYIDKYKKHKITFFFNNTWHNGDWGRTYRKYSFLYNMANLGYSGNLTKQIEINFKTGLRWYDREYQSDTYDSVSVDYILNETSGVEQLIIPIDLAFSYKHFENSNLTIGVDYQDASYLTWGQPLNQQKNTANEATVSQVGFYIQEELQINKFTLRAGGRYNKIDFNINQIQGVPPGSKTESWNVFLWSGGAKYRLTNNLNMFMNSGNSFMPPGLKSIGGTIPLSDQNVPGMNGQLPNPDLVPESGFSIDIGIDAQLVYNIYLSGRAFKTQLTDAIIDIVISQDPSQTMSINANGKTTGKGFEISAAQHIKNKIDWHANITYTKSEITDPDNPDNDGVELPFVPKIMGNVGTTIFFPYEINFSVWMHFGGQIYDGTSKENRKLYNSGELISLISSKTINFNNNNKLNIFIKAHNITNNKYEMPWQFKDTGIEILIGSRFIF